MDDRGVSEVIGFVLVFSLVASTVALVSIYGFSALEQTRDGEQTENAERAFDVLADNMADIHQDGAPSRATEINLEEAQLRRGSTVTMNVTGVDPSGPNPENTYSYEPIVYSGVGDTEIVYSGGAVFRIERQGSVIVEEPPMLVESDRVLLPIVQTQHEGNVTTVSGQTVRIRGENRRRQPISGFTDVDASYEEVIVNVTSPRTELWRRYFEDKPDTTCVTPRADNLRCTIDTDVAGTRKSVYAVRLLIRYQFEA